MVGQGNEALSNFLTTEWLHPVRHPGFEQACIEVYFLRLDRIHPQVSGNKWLKLDYWLQKFRSGAYKGILTSGGPWSNHLHACGFACRLENISMHAIVKGHQQTNTPMLHDLKQWGCQLTFTNKTLFYNEAHWQKTANETDLLFIPMGGEGPEGKKGVTDWFNALPLPYFDAVFVAVGTGTTLSGIAESNFSHGQLYGCDPGTGDEKLRETISGYASKKARKITLLSSGQRLGRASDDLKHFLKDWYAITGVPLDIVYTATLCKTLLNLCHMKQFVAGSRVLLVHTGGLQGNRSLPDIMLLPPS